MCLLNQRLLLIEAGRGRARGGLDLPGLYQETVAGKSCRPRASTFTTSTAPPPPQTGTEEKGNEQERL